MKRPSQRDQWQMQWEVLKNFTPEQLALIGAVAMLYNASEHEVYRAAWGCIVYPAGPVHVTHRMPGIAPVIDILKLSLRNNDFVDDKLYNEICDSLSFFVEVKGYRDAVVHARVKRFDLGIGSLTSRRGTHSEVLITEDALRWLMNAFRLNHRELEQLVTLTHIVHRGLMMPDIREPPEEAFQASLAQYRQCRNQRLKIPATPEFPEVPPLSGYPDDQ